MRYLRVVLARVRALMHAPEIDHDLQEEIASHLDEATEEFVHQGMSPAEARRTALVSFGGVTQTHEAHRDARSFGWFEDVRKDVQYAVHSLRRKPGFSTAVIVTLALGIGVNTALLTIVHQVLLKTLPVSNPQELVEISCEGTGFCMQSYPAFRLLSERHPGLSGIVAFAPAPNGLVASYRGTREVVTGQLASANMFNVLGMRALAGRLLQEADDRADAPPVAVLSYRYWLTRFAGNRDAIGEALTLKGRAVTIVGVLPRDFRGVTFGESYDVVLPLRTAEVYYSRGPAEAGRSAILNDAMRGWLTFVGRRNSAIPLEQVGPDLEPVFRQSSENALALIPSDARKRFHLTADGIHVTVRSAALGASSNMRSALEPTLRVLLVVSTLVLLIACANVAGLFLSQAINRQREFGVRLALGASRSRLLRQTLAESLTFSIVGAGLAVLFAQWIAPIAFSLATDDTGLRAVNLSPDRWMLACAATLCAVAGLMLGAISIVRLPTADPQEALRLVRAQGSPKLAKGLLVCQIALTVTLVGGASLLLQTLTNFRRIDVGFQPRELTTLTMDPGVDALVGQRANEYATQASAALAAVPGVIAVTYSNRAIGTGVPSFLEIEVPGFSGSGRDATSAGLIYIGPAFVRTVGLTLLAGRDVEPTDRADTPHVAVVNESFATHFFGKVDAVGRTFTFGQPVTIVGVVKDARDSGVKKNTARMMYFPTSQGTSHTLAFAIRSTSMGTPVAAAARRALERLDPAIGVAKIETAEAQLDDTLRRERLLAGLGMTFGGLALLLVAVGLYGMLSAMVMRRRVEIGVRMALGATRRRIVWLFASQTAFVVAAGLALGAAGTAAASRLIQSQLFGVTASDPAVIGATVLVLLAVAAFAIWLPAHRAMRINPTEALRHDEA